MDCITNSSCPKPRKVLGPDPANLLLRIILVYGEPALAPCANDVEDLTSYVCQVWIACFVSGRFDPEFIYTRDEEHDVELPRTLSICRCLRNW